MMNIYEEKYHQYLYMYFFSKSAAKFHKQQLTCKMRRFNNQTWQLSTRIFLIKFEEKLDRKVIFHVQKEIV